MNNMLKILVAIAIMVIGLNACGSTDTSSNGQGVQSSQSNDSQTPTSSNSLKAGGTRQVTTTGDNGSIGKYVWDLQEDTSGKVTGIEDGNSYDTISGTDDGANVNFVFDMVNTGIGSVVDYTGKISTDGNTMSGDFHGVMGTGDTQAHFSGTWQAQRQ